VKDHLETVVGWTRVGRFGIEFLSLTQLELHPNEKKPTDDTSEAA